MDSDNQLVIKYDKLDLISEGCDRIVIAPDGEELLVKLLELDELVQSAISEAKRRIGLKMEAINPDLTSISSDKVKVLNRVYGAKYFVPETLADQVDPKFITRKEVISPNTAEIEKFVKSTGELPSGIGLVARNRTVSISLKDKKQNEQD